MPAKAGIQACGPGFRLCAEPVLGPAFGGTRGLRPE